MRTHRDGLAFVVIENQERKVWGGRGRKAARESPVNEAVLQISARASSTDPFLATENPPPPDSEKETASQGEVC